LQHENIDIFIHVDSKCAFSPSSIEGENIYFTERRYDIGLFEFSMIDAERELIRTAMNHGSYEYFILMSGQCYPIVNAEGVYTFLSHSYPESFIEIVAATETNYVKVNFNHVYSLKRLKIGTYTLLKKHFSYKTFRLLRYFPGGIAFIASRLKELFVGSPQKRLDEMGVTGYCGSQWWILPDKVINNVLPYFDNQRFCQAVDDSFSCDETFFQTAIMNNQEKNGIVTDECGNYMNRQWFFIFNDGHPVLLEKHHYDQIKGSQKLFARKFDTNNGSEILDLLDQE
jgi:hypothetical protein